MSDLLGCVRVLVEHCWVCRRFGVIVPEGGMAVGVTVEVRYVPDQLFDEYKYD